MLALALDTSTQQVTAALVRVDDDEQVETLAARDVVAANRHGELLASLVAEVCASAGGSVAGVEAVAVGIGPGPFTGLRVGIVTAAAIADAIGVPAYAVCSLDALARLHANDRPRLACIDARRKQLYWAAYDARGERREGPELATAGDLAERFGAHDLVVVGAGAALYRNEFDGFEVIGDAYPTGVAVAQVAASRIAVRAPGDVLEPMYLRRPDAVPPSAPKRVTPA